MQYKLLLCQTSHHINHNNKYTIYCIIIDHYHYWVIDNKVKNWDRCILTLQRGPGGAVDHHLKPTCVCIDVYFTPAPHISCIIFFFLVRGAWQCISETFLQKWMISKFQLIDYSKKWRLRKSLLIYDLRSTKSFCGGSDWRFQWRTTIFSPVLCGLQGTFNCVILVSGVGGSGDPRRKWESERGRERVCWKVLLLFAKWSKRTIEM